MISERADCLRCGQWACVRVGSLMAFCLPRWHYAFLTKTWPDWMRRSEQ